MPEISLQSVEKIHKSPNNKTHSSVSHTNCAFFAFVYFVFKKFFGAAFICTDG